MAKLKTAKNLLQKRDEYSRYYGDFRGVDFSSDHTQVHDQRLAYSVNMFKDYQSGQGKAIETVPGFRRRFQLPEKDTIYGIHPLYQGGIAIHSGENLYVWDSSKDYNITKHLYETLDDSIGTDIAGLPMYKIKGVYGQVISVEAITKEEGAVAGYDFDQGGDLVVKGSLLEKGDVVHVQYMEENALFDAIPLIPFPEVKKKYTMNNRKSASFNHFDKTYILDGKNFLVISWSIEAQNYTAYSVAGNDAYIPTTYVALRPSDTKEDIDGKKKNHLNFLQPKFRTTFVADGTTTKYYLVNKFQSISEVLLYDTKLESGAYNVNTEEGYIEFNEPPEKPEDKGYPAGYDGLVITASYEYDKQVSQITGCTLYALFDGRVFFSGNPLSPNTLYWCSLNPDTALPDVSYWGMYDHIQVGQEDNAPITGLVPVANTLMVLKGDSKSDGSVYYVTPEATGDKLYPVTYVKQSGLNGIGCLGASCNFLDDPVFVSRLGLEGVGQLSTRLERAIEHRSSLVDAKLCNEDLKTAKLVEWDGYLVLLVNGRIYLADSRQRYTHETGVMQYEWYYLEDIGVYDNMKEEYKYSSYSIFADGLEGDINDESVKVCLNTEKSGFVVPSSCNVVEATVAGRKYYVVRDGDMAYLVEPTGGMITTKESKFYPAVTIESIDGNLFFGTGNGVVCSFNFDMRGDDGSIDPKWYTFDGRAILCGVATKMDNCGIPHLVKNTVKKSTVIKTKTYQTSAAKIKVRTNNKPYEQIARINSTIFSFENMDFSDFSFLTTEQSLFAIREKEKRWVEKQYYIYSDEIGKPFALFYIAFRYNVAGRYKE